MCRDGWRAGCRYAYILKSIDICVCSEITRARQIEADTERPIDNDIDRYIERETDRHIQRCMYGLTDGWMTV